MRRKRLCTMGTRGTSSGGSYFTDTSFAAYSLPSTLKTTSRPSSGSLAGAEFCSSGIPISISVPYSTVPPSARPQVIFTSVKDQFAMLVISALKVRRRQSLGFHVAHFQLRIYYNRTRHFSQHAGRLLPNRLEHLRQLRTALAAARRVARQFAAAQTSPRTRNRAFIPIRHQRIGDLVDR